MTPNLGGPLKEDEQDSYGIYLLVLSHKRLALPGGNSSSANLRKLHQNDAVGNDWIYQLRQ